MTPDDLRDLARVLEEIVALVLLVVWRLPR
jgi:hypothetical protein